MIASSPSRPGATVRRPTLVHNASELVSLTFVRLRVALLGIV